jgi:hypothetical protein
MSAKSKMPAPNRRPLQVNEFVADLTQSLYHRSIQIKKVIGRDDLEKVMSGAVQAWLEDEERRSHPVIMPEPLPEPVKPEKPETPVQPETVPVQRLEDTVFFKDQMRLMAAVCIGLWRLRQKLLKPGTDQPLDEMRRAYRHFESVWDALKESGYLIQDHTNELFTAGMDLNVITYEPTQGIDKESVVETIKPSVYYKDLRIQKGEVIVATPGQPGAGPAV